MTFKRPRKSGLPRPFDTVLNNLEKLATEKSKSHSKLKIHVSFVATNKTFRESDWVKCFETLRDIGVELVNVRQELTKPENYVPNLEQHVSVIQRSIVGISDQRDRRFRLKAIADFG
jgi:hypothetical protein